MIHDQTFEEWMGNTDPAQEEEKALRYFLALSQAAWEHVLLHPQVEPVRIDTRPLDLSREE